MTDQQQTPKAPRPPRFNGPAFLVFGIMILVLGLSLEIWWLAVAGVVFMVAGAYGAWATKRYEKAEGIEEKLPGGGRYNADGSLKDEG